MKAKIKKIYFLFFNFFYLFGAKISLAQTSVLNLNNSGDFLKKTGQSAGYETNPDKIKIDPLIAQIIKIFLSFLGVVFLLLIIYGGFMWMTAQGNESKVETAKKIITRAVIGLAVVLLAYGLTWFVVLEMSNITGFGNT